MQLIMRWIKYAAQNFTMYLNLQQNFLKFQVFNQKFTLCDIAYITIKKLVVV